MSCSRTRPFPILFALALWGLPFALTRTSHAETATIEWLQEEEEVCSLNGKPITSGEVHAEMSSSLLARIRQFTRERLVAGILNNAEYESIRGDYLPPFREALRKILIHRLVWLEEPRLRSRIDMSVIEQKTEEECAVILRSGKGPDWWKIHKRIHTAHLITTLKDWLVPANRPTDEEIRNYYRLNPYEFRRTKGAKVRLFLIPRFHGEDDDELKINDGALHRITAWRSTLTKDISKKPDIGQAMLKMTNFKDIRVHFPKGSESDSYVSMDRKTLVTDNLENLKIGKCSKIFEYDDYWAFIYLEAIRPKGIKPLDESLRGLIADSLRPRLRKTEFKEWLRRTLRKEEIYLRDAKEKRISEAFMIPE